MVQKAEQNESSNGNGNANGNIDVNTATNTQGDAVADTVNTDNISCACTGQNFQEIYVQGLQQNLQQAQTAQYMAAFSLSTSFTSSVLASGDIWPTVTIPNFDSQLMGIVEAVHASQIRLSP